MTVLSNYAKSLIYPLKVHCPSNASDEVRLSKRGTTGDGPSPSLMAIVTRFCGIAFASIQISNHRTMTMQHMEKLPVRLTS
jgi:hypothetical protein